MKRHLWSYVSYFQDNWVNFLPMVKFSANANCLTITKIASFLATQGYNPRMSFDSVDLSAELTQKCLANSKAQFIAKKMQQV